MDLFGQASVDVPSTTQGVIDALRVSVEAAVRSDLARADVDLPPGLRLGGVEGAMDPLRPAEPPPERVERADRDLARYMAILLRPVEGTLCFAFRTDAAARAAQRVWQRTSLKSRVLAFGGARKAGFGTKAESRLGRSLEAVKCERLVLVAPRAPQLREAVELVRRSPERRVLLLNARLRPRPGDAIRAGLADEFEPLFHLRLLESGGLVFRAMGSEGPSPWVIARRRLEALSDGSEAFGSEELWRGSSEPSTQNLRAALGS